MVSELDHLLFEHVVFPDYLDLCLWKMLQQGALRFLVVLILIGTRAVLIAIFPLALIFSCAGFSTFAYLGFFSSYGIGVLNVKSWGGGVEYDII